MICMHDARIASATGKDMHNCNRENNNACGSMVAVSTAAACSSLVSSSNTQETHPFLCPFNVCPLDSKGIVIGIVQLFDKLLVLEVWVVSESEGDLVA